LLDCSENSLALFDSQQVIPKLPPVERVYRTGRGPLPVEDIMVTNGYRSHVVAFMDESGGETLAKHNVAG